MSIDLSKTSTISTSRAAKVITIDIEQNAPKKICCPECKYDEFEGVSTGYGPFRRCKKCRYEWAAGGVSSLAMISPEEREEMKNFQAGLAQENAYNEIMDIGAANDLIADVRLAEKTSGSSTNRSFWNQQLEEYIDDNNY